MSSLWDALIREFTARADGPMALRLLIQPLVACALAMRSGLRDAAEGRPPYGWSLLSGPGQRGALLRDGLKSVGKLFLLVMALDIAYQLIVHGDVLFRQALILAILLAVTPYLLLRGVVTRVAQALRRRDA
jgi:hypothetical protein